MKRKKEIKIPLFRQPMVLTNLNPNKIITKIDYDEKCNIYRVLVKLKQHKRTRK